MGERVLSGEAQRIPGDIDRDRPQAWEELRERYHNRPGARANVQSRFRLARPGVLDGRFYQDLGLGTRDDGGGSDAEGETVELRAAEEIGERLALLPAGEQGIEPRGLVGGKALIGVQEEPLAAAAGNLTDEEFGLQAGLIDSGGGEGGGAAGHNLGDCWHQHLGAAGFRFAAIPRPRGSFARSVRAPEGHRARRRCHHP